jgi:hypothetical protein
MTTVRTAAPWHRPRCRSQRASSLRLLRVIGSHGRDVPDLIGVRLADPAATRDFDLDRQFLALARRHQLISAR